MGVIDDDQTMKKKLQQQQQQQRSSSSTTTATSSSTPYLRRDRGGLELPARSSSAAESTNDVSQQRAFDFEEVPTFWSACDELAQTLTEFEQNQKQAQHALSSYVIENCVLPAIDVNVAKVLRKREFLKAMNVAEITASAMFLRPSLLRDMLRDDQEAIQYLFERVGMFAQRAIEIAGDQRSFGGGTLSRSASLTTTNDNNNDALIVQQSSGGNSRASSSCDYDLLTRASNLLRATLDQKYAVDVWSLNVLRDSRERVANEKEVLAEKIADQIAELELSDLSAVSKANEEKEAENDDDDVDDGDKKQMMTTSDGKKILKRKAVKILKRQETHELQQQLQKLPSYKNFTTMDGDRPLESSDSNRAQKEREAIKIAQKESGKALDKIRQKASHLAEKEAESRKLEQSDIAKEQREAKKDSENRKKVLGSFISLPTVDKVVVIAADEKEENTKVAVTVSTTASSSSDETMREKALARVLLPSSDCTNKVDKFTSVLLIAIESLLKGGVSQEEFPVTISLGDTFESFVTKFIQLSQRQEKLVFQAAVEEDESDDVIIIEDKNLLLSVFDNALSTLSRAHADSTGSDSVRARLARSVARLTPDRETVTNTRLNVILTIFDETMRRHEEEVGENGAMNPDVASITAMAGSIIGMPIDSIPFALTFEGTLSDAKARVLRISLRKCIIDRAIFGSQKVSKRLFRIACCWLARTISEATSADDDKQKELAENALERIFKSSEFIFGLSVHYNRSRNNGDPNDTKIRGYIRGDGDMDIDDDEHDLEDFFEAANAKIIFGLLAWHALPASKRRESALEVCFVRNDYYKRPGQKNMKSLKSIANAHRVASTLSHLIRFFDTAPDFVLQSFKNLANGTENFVRFKDEFFWFPWKTQLCDIERVEANQSSRTKAKFASDLANLGAHQMCAVLADEDNLSKNSNFDQHVANKLKRTLGRLTFLLPYNSARIYKTQIGGSFVERETDSLEVIDEEKEQIVTESRGQDNAAVNDISRSRGGMTLLHYTRDLMVSSSAASSLAAVMNSTEDHSNKIDVLKIFALGSSLFQGTSIDLNKNRNARNPLVLAGFDEALVALTRSVETNVVIPNVVVWTDLARACETLMARREDAINEYHSAQHDSSTSSLVENFCDMVAYARVPKSNADHAFKTYFPKETFEKYENDSFFASISEESWQEFKIEAAKNVGARGKNCGLNVNVERYFMDEITDVNSMTLLLERICVTTVALCKKQKEIDARQFKKEVISPIKSPKKSTTLNRTSSNDEMRSARSNLSQVLENLSRAPMLTGLSTIALTAADAARPTDLSEIERIKVRVSRTFHEALPETLPIALRNIAQDAILSSEQRHLKKERMSKFIVAAVVDRVKRATIIISENIQKTDTRLTARSHPNVALFIEALCEIFVSFSDETKEYYCTEIMSSICESIATISKCMPSETRKALANVDESQTIESITMLLDNVKVKKSARMLVDALEVSLEFEDDVASRALRSMPEVIEKGRFDAAAYILKRYLSEDTVSSSSADEKKETRYIEYAAEAVIDTLRTFYLEDDEDNSGESGGGDSGIFSGAFKQRGSKATKVKEKSSLESFAKLLRLVIKAGKDANRVMSNEASMKRFIATTPPPPPFKESITETSENEVPEQTNVNSSVVLPGNLEDMEYETIEERIARDSEIEHELFEQELLALSNVPIIEQLLRQANLDDPDGNSDEAAARREITLEAAFSSLLSEARVAFSTRNGGTNVNQFLGTTGDAAPTQTIPIASNERVGDVSSGDLDLAGTKLSKCSFISQKDYQRQHWYFCYDCNLVGNRGCCSTCAMSCHKGHRLAYSRESKFSCDCGAGQSKRNNSFVPCGCLTANQASRTKEDWYAEVVGKPLEIVSAESDSELEDESAPTESTIKELFDKRMLSTWTLPKELSAKLGTALKSARVSDVLERVANNCIDKLGVNETEGDSSEDEEGYARTSAGVKKEKIMHFSRAFKPGTFETKPREDFEANTQMIAQVFPLPSKSCLSASSSGLLAVGEGDKVSIISADALYNRDSMNETYEPLLRVKATFEVFNVCFNPSDASKLVMSGLRDAQVLSLTGTSEVMNRISIDNLFDRDQEFGALLSSKWIPGSASTLALSSRDHTKLFDCGAKNALVTPMGPRTTLTPPIGRYFVGCDFFIETGGTDERLIFVALLDNGELHCLSLEEDASFISLCEDTLISTESFPELTRRNDKFSEPDSPTLSFSSQGKNGVSLHYSQTHDILIISYESGDTVLTAIERDQHQPELFKLRAPKVIRDDDCVEEMTLSPLSLMSPTGTGSASTYSEPSSSHSHAAAPTYNFLPVTGKSNAGDKNRGIAYVGDCAFQRDFRTRSFGADPHVPPLSFIAVSRRDQSTRVLTFQNESNFEGVYTQTLLNTTGIYGETSDAPVLRGFAGYQPEWDPEHAHEQRKMLCLLLEDGSLRVYFYGENNEQQSKEFKAIAETDSAKLNMSSTSDSTLDVLYFEGCSEITEKCSIYGEFVPIENDEDDSILPIKDILISDDTNLQIQSARANVAAMLCISFPHSSMDPNLQSFAGIRVQINYGTSAMDANCVPQAIEISKGGRKISLVESLVVSSTRNPSVNTNSEATSTNNSRWFDIPLTAKEAASCTEKNGLLTLIFHPSSAAPRGSCFKISRVLAYSSPRAHIEQSMRTRAIASREKSSMRIQSRIARATRHSDRSSRDVPSKQEEESSSIDFPIVLDEVFSAIAIYARLDHAGNNSVTTTPQKSLRRLSFSKQKLSAAVRVFAAEGWSPSIKIKRSAFKAIKAKSSDDVAMKDFCAVSVALSTFRMIQKNFEWRRDANWALPESDIQSFAKACKSLGRPFVRRPNVMQTCDNEQFQKQTLEALRLGLCLTPRVVRDSHGAYDCEEFVPHLIRALIASCEGFANNPPSAKLAQKAADMAVACLKSGDDNFSRSIALALLDIFAPSIPNAEFFFDQNGTSGITDFLRQPTFVVALKEDVNAASTFADGRVRRPTLLGASSGFANSENTPSGAGILSSFLQAGNPVSGGHRCDMCDETIEGIRWHCEVCDDVDLCSECRARGGITGPLLEQGHRTTHPLKRIVLSKAAPSGSTIVHKKKVTINLSESNRKLISAIVEDICDPTRLAATKYLSAFLREDNSSSPAKHIVGKDSKPPKPSASELNVVTSAHALFLRMLLRSDSEASVLVAKLFSKGLVVPSILSKSGTNEKHTNISERDCRILALSASAAMASTEKEASLVYPDGKEGARDVMEWTKRVVESLLCKIAELGRSNSQHADKFSFISNVNDVSHTADQQDNEDEKRRKFSEQHDKLLSALECVVLQAKCAMDAYYKRDSASAFVENMDAPSDILNIAREASSSTADLQSWTKLVVQCYATSESLRKKSNSRRQRVFEAVTESLAWSIDARGEKVHAIKDAGIILSACEHIIFSLKNITTMDKENIIARILSSPLEIMFDTLNRTPESFALALTSMPSVILAAVKVTTKAIERFPLSAIDQREHACLLFEFAAEYCVESTKNELSGVVDCIIETTLLGSSKNSARDASMTCLRAFWIKFKEIRVENDRQNTYLIALARSLTRALSYVAYGSRIERVSQIVAFALEEDLAVFANDHEVLANLELFCANARKASEKLQTHPRREMYAKLEALEAQSQSLIKTKKATGGDTFSQNENAVNLLLESDEDFAKHAKWLETDPNPDDITLAYASTPYLKTPVHLMKGTRAFTANAALTIFSEACRFKEISLQLTQLKARKSSRWPKSVSIWIVPAIVSASTTILNSSDSVSLASRQLPRTAASAASATTNNIVPTLKSAISWEQPGEPWQFVGNVLFDNRETEGMVSLTIPEDISAIAIRIDSFHVNVHEKASEILPCPRCSRHVQDTLHGICRYCRENAYQCRQCRNINYENLCDAFWCNECGCARHDKLDALITHSDVIGDGSMGIYTEEEATNAMKALEILTLKERDSQNIIKQCESTCRSLLSRASVVDESEILNADTCKSAPTTPSRTKKTRSANTVPATMLASGYAPIARGPPGSSSVQESSVDQNNNPDFEVVALQSYRDVAKNARVTLAKCQTKRISLRRALDNYARRGEGINEREKGITQNYYDGETNHFGSLRSYMFAIIPAMVSLAREKVFFYAFDSNGMKDALFITSSILPQMAPKFARVLVALAVADENVDTRSWLIKQTSERAKTSSLRSEGSGINFTSSTFETDVDVLSRLARMELMKRNDAKGDATIAVLQLSETLNPIKNPNHRFVDVAVRAALKLFEQDAVARPGGRRRMDNEDIDAVTGCIECFINSHALEDETVRLAASALIAISKGTKDERLAVLKSLIELLTNVDVVANDAAAESFYDTLEGASKSEFIIEDDSFVFAESNLSSMDEIDVDETNYNIVKLSVRTLTQMLLEVAKFAWVQSEKNARRRSLVDPSFGLALKRCAKLCATKIVSSDENQIRVKIIEDDIRAITFSATIARALAAQRAPHAISANVILAELLDTCYSENTDVAVRTSVAGTCFELLRSAANANSRSAQTNADNSGDIILPMGAVLDELKRCALPKPKPKRTCLVRLVKSSTQEEFIRGHMSPSPYDVAAQIPVGDNEGNTTSSDAANAVDVSIDGVFFGDEVQTESTPTFRDVKNFICTQLDLVGLIEDDFGMELLSCGNKIISLDLKVVDVCEKFWVPMQQQANSGSPQTRLGGMRIPPMSITYRLSGLDGEATEDRIDSVVSEINMDDPEVRFESTSCLRFNDGLSALVALIPTISRTARIKPILKELCVSREDLAFVRKMSDSTDVLALLQAACELKENRNTLLDNNALPHLLREAARAFEAREDVLANGILKVVDCLLAEEQSKASGTLMTINGGDLSALSAEAGLSVDAALEISNTVDEITTILRPLTPPPRVSTPSIIDLKASGVGGSGIDFDEESMHEEDKNLFDAASVSRSFLDKLKRCVKDGEPKRCDVLARVLPRLACADTTATAHLIKFCVNALKTLNYDGSGEGDPHSCDLLALESVIKIVRCAPHDDHGRSFRENFAIPAMPIIRSYIVHMVVNNEPRSSAAFEQAMIKYKALPFALKILEATSRDCEKTAVAAAQSYNLLLTLHTLESVVVPRGLGTLAEKALETIEDASTEAKTEIENMREKTKEEKRELAKKKREQMLKEMGMMKTEQSEVKAEVSESFKSQLEEDSALDDGNESALRCRVCYESINENPNETLGLYCFCTPIKMPQSSVKFSREDATANYMVDDENMGEDDDDENDDMMHDEDGDIIEIIDMRQPGSASGSLRSALFGGRGFHGRNNNSVSIDPKVDATRGCSSVSHFNAIHFSCHLQAKRADINRRPPKREWEGATLRNAETLCNNVLPVWTSSDLRAAERTSTSDEEYEERRRRYGLAVDSWWDNVGRAMPMNRQSSAMRSDRFRVATFDCVILIGRFATNSSFSIESRGGERESNASLLPQLLRLMQFHGEYIFDASKNPSSIADPSASPLRRQSSSSSPLSIGKKRDIAQREEWTRLANALVDEDYGSGDIAFFDEAFDVEAFENDMYAILLYAAMTFTKERWESAIKIFTRRAAVFALKCGDDGLRGVFTSTTASGAQVQQSASVQLREVDGDAAEVKLPISFAVKPTLVYLAICDEINSWLRKDSPEVFYTPGLSVSLKNLSQALVDEPDPTIREHIRRSEALALDQQSRDQFGNSEACFSFSKKTLELVIKLQAANDIDTLSQVGGRSYISVRDIIR